MTAHKPTTVPRLRFPEFQDAPDWKTGRCRDIAKVLPGYGFPDKFQGNKKGQYPFYKVSDISHTIEKGQRYISEANNYIDSDVLDTIRGKSVPAGTIIFAKIGEAIRSNRRVITTKPAVIDNNTAGVKALKAKSFDDFLFYLWSNVSLIDHAGGVVPAVSKSALESVPLCYPSDPAEQQRIADCLGSLDDLIAADGRKLEALRQHKQGLMQQLFPWGGGTLPQLRFPEFEQSPGWEHATVAELVETVTPPKKLTTSTYLEDGRFPVIDQSKNYICGWTNDDEAIITKSLPVIVFGDHTCVLKFVNRPFAQGADGIKILKARRCVSTLYLYQQLTYQPVATEEYKRHFSVLKKKVVYFSDPKTGEQQKIAECLTSIDDQLNAQACKIDTLKQHKQGLLQQLFPPLESQ